MSITSEIYRVFNTLVMYFAVNKLAPSCPNAKLIEGKVFRRSTGREQLAAWAEGLGL